MLWTPISNHIHGFEMRRYYKMLQTREHCLLSWKSIWKVKASPHIAFFLWSTSKVESSQLIILEGGVSLL